MPSVFDEAIAACRLAAGINPFGSVENARARDAARRVLELVDGYNLHRVAWELERTALNDGFYGNALRAAKDIPGVTDEERALLDRYATGGIQSMDHCALQRLAMKIDEMADRQRDAADKAKVAEPEPVCKCDVRTRLVGDGCEVCNPELAAELAQQPEQDQALSAALGWPGGISDPVLDRKVLLQQVAALRAARLGWDAALQRAIDYYAAEPVAWMYTGIKADGATHGPHLVWQPAYMDAMSASKGAQATPLYSATPLQRPRLTDEEIRLLARDTFLEAENIWNEDTREDLTEFARAIEKKARGEE